ncbi:bromodomain-containing protein 4-like [Achroia grisella]|uniref:bromodomain-containing protein 4-like n=1 Tax=Achroia grisella TaxID=688607 RepID=UPI0027D32277|nr:bromodomain-containing protein 4-like [Achroia grisella]
MGKRKRSDRGDSHELERLFKKVKKLVRTRRRISSSSDSENMTIENTSSTPVQLNSNIENEANEILIENDQMIEESDELDPDILQLLGSDPTQDKTFGENLHKDLAMRWKHILTNGILKEEKANLLKEYLPAENCIPMKAPILNPELKSALSDTSLKKDSYSEQKQNQMSSCISAIGKALNLALTQVENIPQEIIKTLSDAGRLLCDTHYRESLSRRFTIVNSISKQKREIIKNAKIDEYLFGSNLSEHLKTSKVISTSASELICTTQSSNRSSQYRLQPRTTRQGALNARGAPRTTYAEPRVYPGQSRHSVPLQPAPPLQPPPPARGPRDRRTAPPPPTQRSRSYPQQTRRR